MKKLYIVLMLAFICASVFAFEKDSKTKDGYSIKLYQIDKNAHPDSFEFYVRLYSTDTEETFTWCFDTLNKAMEHFKWLEDIKVVRISQEKVGAEILVAEVLFGKMTLEEAQKKAESLEVEECIYDNYRPKWREYAFDAEALSNDIVNYWISKSKRLKEDSWNNWR